MKISSVAEHRWFTAGAWALAAGVLSLAAVLRGAEYDESYTFFLSLGTARPSWPTGIFTVAEAWGQFPGHSGIAGIATDLRTTDVHPPLYFWIISAWRAFAGTSLFATRGFSVLCALVSLGLIGWIARRAGVSPAIAILLSLGCYGFTYTGAIARGFALAQLLNLIGLALLLRAQNRRAATLSGIAFGLACLSNYLAAFIAAAALLWALATRPRIGLAATAGFLASMPAALWFFLAQHAARPGQFPAFELLPALARLGQYAAANIVGGLPLYAGSARPAVTAGLAVLLATFIVLAVRRHWRHPLTPLLGLCALAPAAGLLALGLVFDNTPIELRYLAFATPFAALLLAALPRPALAALLLIQATAIAGLLTRAETMQPQTATLIAASAIAGPHGVVILPNGNDGVGIVGAAMLSAAPQTRLLLLTSQSAPALRAAVRAEAAIALALLALDTQSRAATATMRTAFATDPCWRETARTANLAAYDNICRE